MMNSFPQVISEFQQFMISRVAGPEKGVLLLTGDNCIEGKAFWKMLPEKRNFPQ